MLEFEHESTNDLMYCINTIKLLVEGHKAFYSVGPGNNSC